MTTTDTNLQNLIINDISQSDYESITPNANELYLTDEVIESSDIITALGYTPYNASNPAGYTSNVGTVTSVNNTSPDSNGNVALNIPTVNNGTITINQGGTLKGTFTVNQSGDTTINLDQGGTVDQTYDATSTNAQSGVAIAGAGFVESSDLEEVQCVVETYVNGTSWYRVYSDGWCEQGGRVTPTGSAATTSTIVYLKPFLNTDYFIVANYCASSSNQYGQCYNLTTTQCTTKSYGGNSNIWYACGYIEV